MKNIVIGIKLNMCYWVFELVECVWLEEKDYIFFYVSDL